MEIVNKIHSHLKNGGIFLTSYRSNACEAISENFSRELVLTNAPAFEGLNISMDDRHKANFR